MNLNKEGWKNISGDSVHAPVQLHAIILAAESKPLH